MAKQDHGRDLTGAEMAQMLDEFCNGVTQEKIDEFVDTLVHRTHRTLQQKIASLMLNAFEKWGDLKEGQYDLRNEATVKVARLVKEAIKDVFYKRLPSI